MATWQDLEDELSAWAAAGEVPTFWWRDDDARAPTPALDRLIGLSERTGTPLHLAVVPENIDPGLKARLEATVEVYVFQHGFAHLNHEPKGMRASEVGVSRPLALQEADLRDGWRRLTAAALPRTLPVFVPPWNRIAESTVARLPTLGFRALSRFTDDAYSPGQGPLPEFNGHLDPIRWKEGAEFRGTEKCLSLFLDHLRARRLGQTRAATPTCLVSHHLETDEATWGFMAELLDRLSPAGRGRWLRIGDLLDG
ncbi:MAG: hypothetical protein HKN30_12480 [Sulfitobacter sp.]|nr:hypothetical protein [Sulfitobacter sp.]